MAKPNEKPNYPWIKVQTDLLNDPDFIQCSDGARGLYLECYLLSGRSSAGGLICNGSRAYNARDIAVILHRKEKDTEKQIAELCGAGLLTPDGDGYRIARFMEEQGPGLNETIREKWREAQQRRRAKSKGENQDSEKRTERDLEAEAESDEMRGEEESHRDVIMTSSPLAPPTAAEADEVDEAAIMENLNKKGGAFIKKLGLCKRLNEYQEGIYSKGLSHIHRMIEFGFMFLDTQTRGGTSTKWAYRGYFCVSPGECQRLESFFASFPILEKEDEGEKYREVELDKDLYGIAIDYYFWKWHSEGRQQFRADEIIDLYRNGEEYISRQMAKDCHIYKGSLAIKMIEDITGGNIPETLYPDVYYEIMNKFRNPRVQAFDILNSYFKTWIARGYSPKNLDWFFDWFVNDRDVWEEAREKRRQPELLAQ